MNHLGYLKFILTVIALLLAAGIYLGVQAVDRNRETTRKLGEKLDRIADRLRELPAAARPVPQPVREKRDSTPFANAAYFDPEAVKGGRLILATLADVSNMNDLINNDATVSGFHGFCNSSLAARDYEKPEEYQPLLAESWTISDDHLSYRCRQRILQSPFYDTIAHLISGKHKLGKPYFPVSGESQRKCGGIIIRQPIDCHIHRQAFSIQYLIIEKVVLNIVHLQMQTFHHLIHHGRRLQRLHFIVHIGICLEQTHIGKGIPHFRRERLPFGIHLDEQRSRTGIYRRSCQQIEDGYSYGYNQ